MSGLFELTVKRSLVSSVNSTYNSEGILTDEAKIKLRKSKWQR